MVCVFLWCCCWVCVVDVGLEKWFCLQVAKTRVSSRVFERNMLLLGSSTSD